MERELERMRGVFERPVGSGIWWINYYVNGQQHREKAGRCSDALALYQKRKVDSRRKLKLPEWVPGKAVKFGQLSAMALEHAQTHLRTSRDYVTRHERLSEPFGSRRADEGAAGTHASRLNPDDNERLWTGNAGIEAGSEWESCGNGAQAAESERLKCRFSLLGVSGSESDFWIPSKPLILLVAGAGFEPETFGLWEQKTT
jgi:hypothetical protein